MQEIEDQTGKVYNYEIDPDAYKKARKRQQNRESAAKSRQKKADEM